MDKTPLEIIKLRLKRAKYTGLKKDNYKLALAVEGGGAGAVITLGMLMALKDLDLLPLFDVYVGASAGNLNLVYTLGGRAEQGLSVYYDHVINHKFIDVGRISRGRYILDMKVLEMILRKIVTLPEPKMLNRYADNCFLSLTSLGPVEGRLLPLAEASDHLVDYLVAGCTIPFIGGQSRKVGPKSYIDGTFAYPDMAIASEALGCSHALILSSAGGGVTPAEQSSQFGNKSFAQLLDAKIPDVGHLWRSRLEYSRLLRKNDPDLAASRITAQSIWIDEIEHQLGILSNDQWLLLDGARKGYQAVVKVFQPEATVGLVPEIL